MKILLAPDKFKGCLSAEEVVAAMARGLRRVDSKVTIDACPMADGGEGTVAALVAATGGRMETRRVTGPLPHMKIDASFGVLGDNQTAVIEMASASGVALLRPEQRDPMATTTFGTGELLVAAAELGMKKIILGIGGSATVDGGIGCAQACGLEVVLTNGRKPIPDKPLTGGDLDSVMAIKRKGSVMDSLHITVACDVNNPLSGPNGAAPIFGPQKGATPQQVRQLDAALAGLAQRLNAVDAANTPGAGAAGGLGFGMLAFFGATLRPGIDIVINACDLYRRVAAVNLCLTGEGSLDDQSLSGKTAIGVARVCRAAGVPCIALAGGISLSHGHAPAAAEGLTAAFSICRCPMSLDAALRDAAELIADAAENVLRAFATGAA